jgi:stage V sporulation protein R
LLASLTNMGQPFIYVVDSNHDNRGELYLRHTFEGVELKLDHARDTIQNVQRIWNRPVHIETALGGKGRLLTFDGTEHHEQEVPVEVPDELEVVEN